MKILKGVQKKPEEEREREKESEDKKKGREGGRKK